MYCTCFNHDKSLPRCVRKLGKNLASKKWEDHVMDLDKIFLIGEGHYRVPRELIDDVRLIFTNAKEYNQQKSQVCILLYISVFSCTFQYTLAHASQYTLVHPCILLYIPVYYCTSQYTLVYSSILFHVSVYSCKF